ncbi:hypothetical protein PMI18_01881 [Pseudomonas sp. GM102]|uniref:hypothetical protein n=1 Tax=Pseudomonas sp. GM102 TaxID=1144321 RepID=UPI00026F6EE2|nr:hypothetical protein [Pseudomonas sp. GM102]EJM02863.1 hypothetical protein PMI18_01881 [Pseudomonas sp. GM102]
MTTQENLLAGTLDLTFNEIGMLTIDYGDPEMGSIYIRQIKAEEMGPNPGIYFAGPAHHFLNGDSITVGRLHFDGTPDTSFGPTENGLVQLQFPKGIAASVTSFAIQSDGNIIIEAIGTGQPMSCFARFKPNGSLDSDFGQDGFAIIPLQGNGKTLPLPEGSDTAPRHSAGGLMGLELLPDGKILACHYHGVILRLTPDGALDKSFNKTGFLKVVHPGYAADAGLLNGILRRDDGKYVAAGTLEGNQYDAMFVCCDTAGELDKSFGSNGNGFVVIKGTPEPRGLGIERLARQPNGRILGIGADYAYPYESGLLISREPDGKPNIQFNRGEPVYTRLADEKMRTLWMGAASQKDGKTVVAGGLGSFRFNDYVIVVARFNADGKEMDKTFGNGQGWVKTRLPTEGGYATNMTLQDDGKILVCAVPTTISGFEHRNPTILRYLS